MAGAVIVWGLALTSCAPPPTIPPGPHYGRLYGVVVWPGGDLATGATPAGELVGERVTVTPQYSGTVAEFTTNELFAWEGNFRLVRWPSLEPASGDWDLVDTPDGGMFMVFDAEPDLPRGWYAVQIDFDAINERRGFGYPVERGLAGYDRRPVIDGWTTTRFHVGSLPIVRVSGSVFSESDWLSELHLVFDASEVLTLRQSLMEHLAVTADGAALRCELVAGSRARTLSSTRVRCDPAPDGALVEIAIDETLRTTLDAPLYDLHGHSPPTWTFVASGLVEGDGVPGDALFEAP